jgi:hypothetical protein
LGNKTIKRDARIAEHLKLTELAVLSTVLELHADLMLTLRILRQLKGNDRSIVHCELVSVCSAKCHTLLILTSTRNVGVSHGGIRDVEQTDKWLVIDFLNIYLDLVRSLCHVTQGPKDLR